MYKKLVRYDKTHFTEVDPVRLKRTAARLRDLINLKIPKDNDPYSFHTLTLPILEAAIRGEIGYPLNQDASEFISSNFIHDKGEGIMPPTYDGEFTHAVADFSVTAEALSFEDHQHIDVNGQPHAWLEFEDEGDWPDKVKFP